MKDDLIGQHSLRSVQVSLRYQWWLTVGNVCLTFLMGLFWVTRAEVGAKPAGLSGAPPLTLNYQGRLSEANGLAVEGTLPMSFSFFNASSGGSLVWGPEIHPAVVVAEGLFQVSLGSVNGGIPLDIWENSLYLEVEVNGEVLVPRELIQPTATAGVAFTVPDGTITTSKLAPDVLPNNLGHVNYSEIITITESNQLFTSTAVTLTVAERSRVFISAKADAIVTGNGSYYAGICKNGVLIPHTHRHTPDVTQAPNYEKFSWNTIDIVNPGTYTYTLCAGNSIVVIDATLQWYRPVISLIAFPTE